MVDLSTAKIIGNQCADNIVRVKPFIESDSLPCTYREGELMGTLTLIGERHLAQYDMVYTAAPSRAASIHRVPYSGMDSYINPEVSMPQSEMARYAWAVYGSGRKYNQVVSKAHGIKATVNNIYAVGDYFFIDYSLQNRTKIPYSLNLAGKFRKNYRNVLVLDKLTFPEEKVLRIEISENQISGRVITLTIEYDDILNADGFDSDILRNLPFSYTPHIYK